MASLAEFGWQPITSTNVLSIDGQSDAIAIVERAVVSTQEVSLAQLRILFDQFENELKETLPRVFSMTSTEFSEWHAGIHRTKYNFDKTQLPPSSCIAFKRSGDNFHFIKRAAVMNALIDAGLVSARNVKGMERREMPKGAGVIHLCPSLPIVTQRQLIKSLFPEADLDSVVRLGEASSFDAAGVRKILRSARDAEEAFHQLARGLWLFDATTN